MEDVVAHTTHCIYQIICKDLKPVKNKNVIPINRQTNRAVTHTYKHNLTTKVKNGPTVIVELDTPKHLDTDLFFENIGKLDEANIDLCYPRRQFTCYCTC